MLINVFGLWVNPDHIAYVEDDSSGCHIWLIDYRIPFFFGSKKKDEVAAEINKQIAELKKD